MMARPFGGASRTVAVIGQGTWYIDHGDRPAAITAIRTGLDAGATHIDTAEMYDEAEPLVGEAIAGRRDDVFLVSKVMPQNASRRVVRSSCERSLRRLGTDRLDCYLLHWPGSHPLEHTVAAFEELCREGKILSWGVSNFDVADLDALASVSDPGRIACNQVLYHLQERAIEHAVLPWCREHGVATVAYSPFGHDRFPAASCPGGAALARIAADRGATPRQVALAFLTRDPSTFAIPKAADAVHAIENATALVLTPDEISRIDGAFPLGPKPRHLPML